MKKYLLLFTSAALLLVGCAKEQIVDLQEGELTNVTFTANVDNGATTKALADNDGKGASVNRCIMEIYYGDTFYKRLVQPVSDKVATFANVPVVAGKQYTVLFWADCGEGTDNKDDHYYTTTSLKAVTVKKDAFVNALSSGDNDKLDAFFFAGNYTVKQGDASYNDIKLHRPFAQLNVITTDVAANKAVISEGLLPDAVKVSYTAYNTFNVADSTASGSTTYSYEADVYGDKTNWSAVKSRGELTLSMDYVLAAADKGAIDVEFKIKNDGADVLTHNLTNLPYQRNFRTNVKGDLLTIGGTWTATIEPAWSTPDYDVPYYVASSIDDAQNYISNQNTEQAKSVDLTKAEIKLGDVKDDGTIHFILKTTSPQDLVNFTLPAIPQGITATGWTIEYQEGYPTKNVGVNAPAGTKVTILAPTSHVIVTGTSYAEITASTGDNTLVIPQGVTVDKLIVTKGAVEIHGTVNSLTVTPEEGKTVCFRECEGLSKEVFEKIFKEGTCNYLDPMYGYKQVGEKYNIYKLPVVAKIGVVEYPSIAAALAAVQANETIEILSDIALDKPITISNSDITIDGNNYTIAVSDAEYWNQYKIGGANQGLGKVNMISVKGSNFTLKDVTLDGKDCRGVSLCTTSGGKDVLYQNVTYTGRGSGHYYGEAAGLVTFDGCKFDTHGYAVHFGGESSVDDDDVVIKDCELNGWSSFGACKSVTISDSHFGGANDEGKNGWLAVLRPYCPTTITNCTFSDIFLHEAVTGYDCIGLGTGAATTVVLKGCKIVNDSKEETDAAIYSIVRDNGFDNAAAQQGSVFAFDATGNATDGYTAGTFYAKDPAKIKVAPSYDVKPVEGKENVFTVVAKPVAEFNGQKYTSFESALNAAKTAKGGKVTLVDDVTLTRTDYKGCSSSDEDFATRLYTIDLNGHKISGGLFAFEDCSYTIEDSVGGGSISRDGSCLQLNVSQFMASKMCTFSTCPTFTVKGGEFIGAGDLNDPYSCKYGAQIGAMGTYDHTMAVSKFLISGGKIRNMRIYNGKGEISGGAFEGQLKIEVCTEGSDKYASGVTYSDLVTTILGGTFNLAETNPIFGADYAKDRLSEHLQIKGGTFNFNPSVNYSACIPAGYTSQDNGDGTWTVLEAN